MQLLRTILKDLEYPVIPHHQVILICLYERQQVDEGRQGVDVFELIEIARWRYWLLRVLGERSGELADDADRQGERLPEHFIA